MRYVLALLLTLTTTSALARDSGIIGNRAGTSVLIQKDVNGARWAITLDIEHDLFNLTGNVFQPDGSAVFLDCEVIDVVGPPGNVRAATFTYNCYWNSTCPKAFACPGWKFLRTIDVPGTFFAPPP